MMPTCSTLQGIADSGGDGRGSYELEVALQWLDVLYARDCHSGSLPADGQHQQQGRAAEGSASSGLEPEHGEWVRQRASSAGTRSGGRTASPLAESRYERTLLQLLGDLQEALPPSSKVIAR